MVLVVGVPQSKLWVREAHRYFSCSSRQTSCSSSSPSWWANSSGKPALKASLERPRWVCQDDFHRSPIRTRYLVSSHLSRKVLRSCGQTLAVTVRVQLGLRWWKLAVEGLEDWADQDPRRDPRQRVAGLEQLSGVCQVLESVIVLRLGDSGRAR